MDTVENDTLALESPSNARRLLSWIAWGSFGIFCLLFFTLQKIPQGKIHAYVTGYIASQLTPMGIQFTADEGALDLGLGISYRMSGVKLTRIPRRPNEKASTLKLTEVSASPSFLGLLSGKLGGHLKIDEGSAGRLDLKILMVRPEMVEESTTRPGQNPSLPKLEGEVTFDAKELKLGQIGALSFFTGIEGNAEISGQGEFIGDFNRINTLSGEMKTSLKRVVIDKQSIMGFPIPRIGIADGQIDVTLGGGKLVINQFRLGKPGGTDDLNLTVTGDVKLKPFIETSEANLRGKAGFSEAVKQSLASLEFLLQRYRQPDGSLGFRMNGPIGQIPAPDTP